MNKQIQLQKRKNCEQAAALNLGKRIYVEAVSPTDINRLPRAPTNDMLH
jgi:hypothetical protein